MEEYTQVTLDEWMSWKEDIRRKLQETAGNFVYIGYRLKQIRESGMLNGCNDIFEFAKQEYGLGKSTVSRFIAINEKFSEDGNSLELREEYKSIGSSKLAEMLTLPDAECQLITGRTTVKEIRDLKNFKKQEIEENMEEPEEGPIEDAIEKQVVYTALQKCIIDYFSQVDKKGALNYSLRLLQEEPTEESIKCAAEVINPGEYTTHKKGIIFLFLYDYHTGIKYKSMVEKEPVSMTYAEFLLEVQEIYKSYASGEEKDVWTSFYGVQEEKKEEKIEEKTEEKTKPQKVAAPKGNQGLKPPVATSQQTEKEEENRQQDIEVEDTTESIENVTESAEMVVENEEIVIEREEIVEGESKDAAEQLPEAYEIARERAIEVADLYILENLKEWKGQEMPLEEIQRCIENTNILMKVLQEFADLQWKQQLKEEE